VKSRIPDGQTDGLVIYSGTIPVVSGKLICGDLFRGDLVDDRLKRRLTVEYRVTRLEFLAGADL
jgi:hypothetical protein